MKADAPGKLILSGEHSVVYGAPAIAVAVANKVEVSFSPNSSDALKIVTEHLGEAVFRLCDMQALFDQLDQRYADFLDQKLPINQVLSSPFELLLYTLAQHGFDLSGTIHISSDIPAGSGMGSSAAVIGALIKLAARVKQRTLPIEQLFQDIRHCERLQHGKGSVIDAAAVAYGKPVKVSSGNVTEISLALDSNWYLWNSGSPASTTGEVVAAVREQHADSSIWQEFSRVTNELEESLQCSYKERITDLVKTNQNLLERIGVVPDTVSQRIRQIEELGGAGKICGAGSIKGSCAGMVLLYLPDISAETVEQQLNIHLEPLSLA